MSFRNFLFRLYRAREIKKHQLDYLFWECTLKCNLNCLHCGSDCTKDSYVPDMPVADFVKVLDDIKINGKIKTLSVCITGGEPLIRKDIEVAGREIISRGYNWGIVTNGMLFTAERFVSLLNAGMRSMSFSIDGFEEQHTYSAVPQLTATKPAAGVTYGKVCKFYTVPNGERGVKYQIVKA